MGIEPVAAYERQTLLSSVFTKKPWLALAFFFRAPDIEYNFISDNFDVGIDLPGSFRRQRVYVSRTSMHVPAVRVSIW